MRLNCDSILKMALKNLKVFIIHADYMEIRKKHIENFVDILKKNNIDFEYLTKFDPNKITHDDIKQKINLNKQNNGEFFDELIRNLHVNQLSNGLKHGEAIELAKKESSKYDYFLFVEDDILYGDDVMERLKESLTLLDSSDSDIMFLGLPSLEPIQNKELNVVPTSKFYKIFPCCDSYLISSKKIGKVSNVFYPIKYITNFQLAYISSVNNLNTQMVVPNIFLDGTKYGAFLSSLDPNNKMLFNPDFIRLSNMLQNGNGNIESELENIKFKNHPDVMHLQAIYAMSKGEYKKAESILENILNVTVQNGCMINNETEFLKTYIRLHRFTQDLM